MLRVRQESNSTLCVLKMYAGPTDGDNRRLETRQNNQPGSVHSTECINNEQWFEDYRFEATSSHFVRRHLGFFEARSELEQGKH